MSTATTVVTVTPAWLQFLMGLVIATLTVGGTWGFMRAAMAAQKEQNKKQDEHNAVIARSVNSISERVAVIENAQRAYDNGTQSIRTSLLQLDGAVRTLPLEVTQLRRDYDGLSENISALEGHLRSISESSQSVRVELVGMTGTGGVLREVRLMSDRYHWLARCIQSISATLELNNMPVDLPPFPERERGAGGEGLG